MKIAYVIDYLFSTNGGTERQLYHLIDGMVARGHHVELFVLRQTKYSREVKGFPCPLRCLEIKTLISLAGIRKFWRFRRMLIDRGFDVVHGYFNDVALALPPLLFGSGLRSYTSRRDMGFWYSPIVLMLLRCFRFAGTRIICNCRAVAEITVRKEWKAATAIRVIYNGIEPFRRADGGGVGEWAPTASGDGAEINVVLVANIRRIKRIQDVIRTAGVLKSEGRRLCYFIVGHLQDREYCDSLQDFVVACKVEDCFHFTGLVREPRRALERFDVGLLTSESEGFSNTIMEYMDAGLAVVASRVGGNPELVTHGETGYLYEVGNIDELASCLRRLADDPELRRTLATNAGRAVQKFDIDTMISRHEQEYTRDR